MPSRAQKLINVIGPGIFLMGYIIGTGSVTTLANAGSRYGMAMLWALALSCVFTFVMITGISRLTIVGGDTILQLIRQRFGLAMAIFILCGLMVTVVASVIGLTAIISEVLQEWTKPLTSSGDGIHPIISAAFCILLLYSIFMYGRHQYFLKAMAIAVAVMGLCFIASMILVVPSLADIAAGIVPALPKDGVGSLALAGLVGTTMASVCLVARSYLASEQNWSTQDLAADRRDASLSLTLTFVVSGAIMASAAGTLYIHGITIENAVDMVATLRPIAGEFAMFIFTLGILAAGMSSLFASYLLGPWMVCDLLKLPRRMNHSTVRVGVLLVALTGFTVPVFGGRPVAIMIASQAFSPVIMPLLVALVFVLLNHSKTVGPEFRNSPALNISLLIAFVFTLVISAVGIVGLTNYLRTL